MSTFLILLVQAQKVDDGVVCGVWRGRTEVIVDEAYSAVAGQVGIPICEWLEPFRESAGGAHVGSERRTKRTEEHRFFAVLSRARAERTAQ